MPPRSTGCTGSRTASGVLGLIGKEPGMMGVRRCGWTKRSRKLLKPVGLPLNMLLGGSTTEMRPILGRAPPTIGTAAETAGAIADSETADNEAGVLAVTAFSRPGPTMDVAKAAMGDFATTPGTDIDCADKPNSTPPYKPRLQFLSFAATTLLSFTSKWFCVRMFQSCGTSNESISPATPRLNQDSCRLTLVSTSIFARTDAFAKSRR
mmetsp:Transcript_60104/g.105168  ORF Transcript_60104/g.105168 Transcript_60104/m.105168 type:complete len:208 (-) Transcript_60104:1690-2313(-)